MGNFQLLLLQDYFPRASLEASPGCSLAGGQQPSGLTALGHSDLASQYMQDADVSETKQAFWDIFNTHRHKMVEGHSRVKAGLLTQPSETCCLFFFAWH